MVFNQSYFDRQYRHYELQNPPRKLAFYRSLVTGAVGGLSEPRIMDIGCAFGLFLGGLSPTWRRCGVDVSEYALQHARNRFPDVSFQSYMPGAYPQLGPFDVVTAFDVLEHVAQLGELLDWIRCALSTGGRFVFVVPVYDGPTGPVIRLLDHDPTHIHRMRRTFWLETAQRYFRMVEWWGVFRYLLPGGHYFHLVTRRLRWCTPAIACVVRRD